MGKVYDYIADIFMPNRCPCCGRFIKWDELVCGSCENELKPCEGSSSKALESCSAVVCVFRYEGLAKQGIYSLKDGCGANFARYGAAKLAELLRGCGAELMTCVPMAKRKKAERGYDQAELTARYLAEKLGLPCDFSLLKRRSTSLEQHDLSAAERAEFAKTLYSAVPKHRDISGRKLLLIDDVCTTGATLSSCAGCLLEMGAEEVIGAAICRTVYDPGKKEEQT